MEVSIKQTTGRGVRSGETVRFEQYTITVDSGLAGYIGFAPSCRCCLIRKFSPIEMKEIEDKVAKLVGQDSQPGVQAPDVPDEVRRMLNPDLGDELDDLDS